MTRQNIIFNENFLEAIGKNNDYIIQPGLTQDPEISRIYSESVNTCRVITENKKDCPVLCVLYCVLAGVRARLIMHPPVEYF